MSFLKRLLMLLALLAAQHWLPAQSEVLRGPAWTYERLSSLSVLEDPKGEWTLEQISSPEWAGRFTPWPTERGQINLGFTRSVYWIRVPLQREAEAPRSWVLEIPYFQLLTVDFYAPGQQAIHTGGALPLSSRPFFHRFFAFPVEVSTEPQNYYFRVTSDHSLTVPLTAWAETNFLQHVQSTLIVQALYFGGLIALMLYNLFLSISLKDVRFFLYTFFVGNFGMGMLAGNGFGQMFLWSGQGWFDGLAQSFFLCLSGCFAMLFAHRFLQAKKYSPKIATALVGCSVFYLVVGIGLVSSPWHSLPIQWLVLPVFIVTVPAGALVIVAGVSVMRQGYKGARYFLLAWLVLWSGAAIAVLRAFELVPTTTLSSYSLQLSSALEMLLLSLALADVVHLERQEREVAQKEALLANQHLLESARHSEARLEQEVQKRTDQLERALSTETQLLERYMRFGALISHEFRNPLGIVESQITLLRKEHEKGQLHLEKRLEVMSSATQRLLSLFNTWLKGDRLQQSMREMTPQHIPLAAWLRELIDAQAVYHSSHPLSLQIRQAVGDVWADESLLEVVVLNLLDNACKYSESGQAVTVETRAKPGWVGIAVTDQGCGIDSNHHSAILDDYYRVDPESTISGIGLGLAFVRRIVQMHQGDIELTSALGKGSTFCVWLPHAGRHDGSDL